MSFERCFSPPTMQNHQQSTVAPNAANGVSRQQIISERILRTALIVRENISKILENKLPSEASTQHPQSTSFLISANGQHSGQIYYSNAKIRLIQRNISGECTAYTSSQTESVNHSSKTVLHPIATLPNLQSSCTEIAMPNGQGTSANIVQNFATSLNGLWLNNEPSNTGEQIAEEDTNDDIIYLGTSTNQEEIPLSCENVETLFSPSPAFSGTNFSTRASPCFTQPYAGSLGAVFDCTLNFREVMKDQIVVKLMHSYVEWSLKYPKRRKGFQVLVDAIERRAAEIGAQDFKLSPKLLTHQLCPIRKRMRQTQHEELAKQTHEQNAMLLPSNANVQQQPMTCMQQPTNFDVCTGANPTADEEEVEVLGCYLRGRGSSEDGKSSI